MFRRVVLVVMASAVILTLGAAALAQETPPPAPAPAAAPPPAGPAAPVVSKVKIVVDDKAKSDGEIRFAFTPAGGTAKEIRVTVAKGMSVGDICRDIAKELSVGVGSSYEVDHYDRDKIKVEGKKDAQFSLTLSGQTVSGLSVTLK